MNSTQKAMADSTVSTIYEAAFRYDDVRTRIDILISTGEGSYDMVEVKSSTQLKDEHIPDVGIQLYILNGNGINVRNAYLRLINKEYIYPGGEYDVSQLIRTEDITELAKSVQPEIPRLLTEMRNILGSMDAPEIKAGKHCSSPYECSFYEYCHASEPEHHISQLPRASEKLLQSLEELGIYDIRDIPSSFTGLNSTQQRVRDCVVNNRLHVDSELCHTLQQLEYPIHFLDFETFNPALPIYIGTCPYQVIPFQWSDHILNKTGEFRHEEFLHEEPTDPRRYFIESLLNILGSEGSIVVYSSYEATRIRELAVAFPEMATSLLKLLDGRIIDLLQLVRKYCYHPEFHGSFSIKSVLPALVPGMDYKDLDITDGGTASVAYAEMIHPETTPERRNSLKKSLLAYCKRDTEAEFNLFKVLSK
jgi:CRISPR/Cas system-associated exonuclease Cas4 (RecB family)